MDSFDKAIQASLENGDRLLEDAQWLLDLERYATTYALCILAQEEYAKAFLLHLIDVQALPWNIEVRRVLRDHACKQLLGLILDFLNPDIDEFLARIKKGNTIKRYRLPSYIADAINIIRYEKVPREDSYAWRDQDDPPCNPKARKIANGQLDKQKQDALYVRLGKTGQVASTPLRFSAAEATKEFEKAKRLGEVLDRDKIAPSGFSSFDYKRIVAGFKLVFGLITLEQLNKDL